MKKNLLKMKLGLLFIMSIPFIVPGWVAGIIWQGLEAGFYFGYNAVNHVEDKIDDLDDEES